MTREEFCALPPGIALGLIYDVSQRIAALPVPPTVRPPKFDGRLSRKGGYCWMSEMDLGSLRYWFARKSEPGKPEFAEKDAKTAKELGYWIAWRTADPAAAWSGERNREPARGAPPSRDPQLHQWEPKAAAPAPSSVDDDLASYGFE